MAARIAREPSPTRTGFVHGGLCVLTLAGLVSVSGSIVHLVGDTDDASPAVTVALFNSDSMTAPALNPRLPSDTAPSGVTLANLTLKSDSGVTTMRDLGIEYERGQAAPKTRKVKAAQPPAAQPAVDVIKINGKPVQAGQSFLEVSRQAVEIEQGSAEPVPERRATKFERYAKPFVNPGQKPTVSIIVGGLGIPGSPTRSAVNELPAEITLSFAPATPGLRGHLRRARNKGHEVLIELPMEASVYGREKPHRNVLSTGVTVEDNLARVRAQLASASGYAGVMNYQGDKFSADRAALSPVFDLLSERGLAFFHDGALPGVDFTSVARQTDLVFANTVVRLDDTPEADAIEKKLLMLEAEALEHGHALGTGMPLGVTIDILKAWTERLESKGIVLAPASYYAKQTTPSGQTGLHSLNPAP